MNDLPFRQLHLDFHTSEFLPDVAAAFDPEAFAETLVRAGVQSVNLFARCWHGWLYYDSKRFPEQVHPNLVRRDLLSAQITACHARSIRPVVYVGVQVCNATALRHPEWRQVRPGQPNVPATPGHRGPLCLNTPFAMFMDELVEELCDVLPAFEGFWFDGVNTQDCQCPACVAEMRPQGLDPANETDRARFGHGVVTRWTRHMSARVRALKPKTTLFYNAGHLGPGHVAMGDAYTHWEVESVPFAGWGFTHSPAVMRYVRTTGKPVVGMTVRFHTGWGDLHSYKHPVELEYECFQMLALGARCCIGDHLHPSGRMDVAAYDLIGSAYRQIAAIEPWCADAYPMAEAAVLTPESSVPVWGANEPLAIRGAVVLLQELGVQFDIVDASAEVGRYRLLVLPDDVRLSTDTAIRIDAFVAAGGAVLCSGVSGLAAVDGAPLSCLGVERQGEAPWRPDFVRVRHVLGEGVADADHTMYLRGQQVRALAGTDVLAEAHRPHFNAEGSCYAVDRSTGEAVYPAVTRCGATVYFAHPVFRIHHELSPSWVKTLVANAIRSLLPTPLVRHEGPATLLTYLHDQPMRERWVLHLLHYVSTNLGGQRICMTERLLVREIDVVLTLPGSVGEVRLEPQGTPLPFEDKGGHLHFRIPSINGHQLVVLDRSRGSQKERGKRGSV
jgi:hypothetical protein